MSGRASFLGILVLLVMCAGAGAEDREGSEGVRASSAEFYRTGSQLIRLPNTLVIPGHINYQGYLADDVGNPLSDTLNMSFGLWDAPSGGTVLWSDSQSVEVVGGLFNVILGSVTPIPSSIFQAGASTWLELTVEAQVLSPRTEVTSVGYAYRAVLADDADAVDGFSASGAPGPNDLFPLTYGDGRYVNEGQSDAVTGAMIVDGEVTASDLAVDAVITTKIMNLAVTTEKMAGDAVVSGKVLDSSLTRDDVADTFKSPYADTADYALAAPASPDNDWAVMGNVLFSNGNRGLSMRSYNSLYGIYDSTHVNLGVQCTTGISGQDRAFCTVSGGFGNSATYDYAVAGGGSANRATGYHSVVSGGERNMAAAQYAAIGGGRDNTVSLDGSTIAGGGMNSATGSWAGVGGGWANQARGNLSVIGGGESDTVRGHYGGVLSGFANKAGGVATDTGAVVAGGRRNSAIGKGSVVAGGMNNLASATSSLVCGGEGNTASGVWSTVAGGYGSTCDATDGFVANSGSTVLSGYDNSAAFNGQTSTMSGETRVGTLSKAGGTFTIDHPLDPDNKILNHYFVESPEMVLIYRGAAVIGPDGRAEVRLPDYFATLNRNPMVQLTGVGTYEVFVAEKVEGNRFVIGGKPGTEVYWTVTGDRKDQAAEILRLLKPVEQPKEGGLAGRSLDDEYLSVTMRQLERTGQAGRFDFRSVEGRKRYEEMNRRPE